MVSEFSRYGLPKQRKLVGILEILGASGLLMGLLIPSIGAIAATGLSILMLLGFGVRIKIKDNFFQSFPAFVFLFISAGLAYQFIKII